MGLFKRKNKDDSIEQRSEQRIERKPEQRKKHKKELKLEQKTEQRTKGREEQKTEVIGSKEQHNETTKDSEKTEYINNINEACEVIKKDASDQRTELIKMAKSNIMYKSDNKTEYIIQQSQLQQPQQPQQLQQPLKPQQPKQQSQQPEQQKQPISSPEFNSNPIPANYKENQSEIEMDNKLEEKVKSIESRIPLGPLNLKEDNSAPLSADRKTKGCQNEVIFSATKISEKPIGNVKVGKKTTYTVKLIDKENGGKAFERSVENVLIVGRKKELSDLVIDYDRTVSSRQCKIYIKNKKLYVSDLGGTNITYLNDKPLQEDTPIETGDVLGLGRLNLKVSVTKNSKEVW